MPRVFGLALLCISLSLQGAEKKLRHHGAVHRYTRAVTRPSVLGRSAAGAGVQHLTNRPHEWGHGPLGYAKRFGSNVGTHAVKTGIEMSVGGMLHEQKMHHRATRPGFTPKLKSALGNTFEVHHRNSNKRYPAVGRMSGAFGSGLVSRAWQPARLHTVGSGLSTGGIALGADFGVNMAREYFPRHKHGRRHRRVHAG